MVLDKRVSFKPRCVRINVCVRGKLVWTNTFVLIAIWKKTAQHRVSLKYIRSSCASDRSVAEVQQHNKDSDVAILKHTVRSLRGCVLQTANCKNGNKFHSKKKQKTYMSAVEAPATKTSRLWISGTLLRNVMTSTKRKFVTYLLAWPQRAHENFSAASVDICNYSCMCLGQKHLSSVRICLFNSTPEKPF